MKFILVEKLENQNDNYHKSRYNTQKSSTSKIQVKYHMIVFLDYLIFDFLKRKSSPNSYRIISEEVPEHEGIPFWYGNSRPPALYTEPSPSQLPAQVSEPRNNPHAGRQVDVVYSNATNFNAPLGIVKTDNVKQEEARWWDWSQPSGESYGPGAKTQEEWMKTKESSYRNAFNIGGESGPYAKKNTRYSANPHQTRTFGIGIEIFQIFTFKKR